ncbi:hypothetical protein GCM10007919_15600 [Rhizobium indigoferae]|nr:hypothetical protein GCM10007919_15600 [Rhizobium indigoferae]
MSSTSSQEDMLGAKALTVQASPPPEPADVAIRSRPSQSLWDGLFSTYQIEFTRE